MSERGKDLSGEGIASESRQELPGCAKDSTLRTAAPSPDKYSHAFREIRLPTKDES